MEITAAVVDTRDGPFHLEQAELDEPRTGELVVRIVAAGMCHTDLSVRGGATPFPLPAVLGHEGAGVVEAVGPDVTAFAPGDPVLISFTSCGDCPACRAGRPVYCDHWIPLNLLGGSRLDGSPTVRRSAGPVHGHFFGQSSFASHALVHERAAVRAPDGADLTVLAPLGCSVQTGVGAVLNVARPGPGATLAVFGAGAVGLSAVIGAALAPGTRVIAVDVVHERLQLAAELGAAHTVDASAVDVVETLRDLTGGRGVDHAIETSGRLPVLAGAIDSLAAAGTCIVIGAPPLGSTIAVDVPNLLGRGITLRGTNQGDADPARFLPHLLDLHAQGRLPIERLITHYPFTSIDDAASDAAAGKAIKPVLVLG